jgi:microcystin-dependent protein
MEEYLGIVKLFAGTFAPRGWAFCNGQLLPISQNTALFSILGTNYGGDGSTTFGLPDLRGRVAVGAGQGPGLTPVQVGQVAGTENVSILITNMPAHTHVAASNLSLKASSSQADTVTPAVGSAFGAARDINTDPVSIYSTATPSVALNPASGSVTTTVQAAGGSQPLPVRNPFLGMNYIICLQGLFPSRD